MKIDTCYKTAVFLIAGILLAGCGSSSSDDLADKLRENVELAKEQDISDEKDSEDISEETAAEDGSSKQDEDNDAGTAEELTEDTSEETEHEDVEDASETEEESEPYGDILRWYKTLQDSGKTDIIQFFYPDYQFKGQLRGNMYKCGNKTENKHYISWTRMDPDRSGCTEFSLSGVLWHASI